MLVYGLAYLTSHMNLIALTLRQHASLIRRFPLAIALLLLICGTMLWHSFELHEILHGVGYLLAVWLCAFVIDLVVNAKPRQAIGFPIKRPVRSELRTILLCEIAATIYLVIHFSNAGQTMPRNIRILLLPLMAFVFPIVLALIYLFRYKYRLRDLGINLHYWWLALIVHVIIGAITIWVAPEKIHWLSMYKEYCILGWVLSGFIGAALSEEFVRMLFQTRLGAAFKDMGLGLVLASVIWGLMHIPANSQGGASLKAGTIEAIEYIPIGVLWGYMTHRTRSMIPAILLHGLNAWGLQNF